MNKERLIALAEHLEVGQLIHKVFDFNKLNTGSTRENPCGSNGCAIGELPAIDNNWYFLDAEFNYIEYYPACKNLPLKRSSEGHASYILNPSFEHAAIYFELTMKEIDTLFAPSEFENERDREHEDNSDSSSHYEDSIYLNGNRLYKLFGDATREEVAAHIREFVRLKELVNE